MILSRKTLRQLYALLPFFALLTYGNNISLASSPSLNFSKRAQNATSSSAYYNKILVGYYGRPYNKYMGILGQYTPEDLVQKLRERAELYSEAVERKLSIMPVFHLVYGMASTSAFDDNSYLDFLRHETVMKYINVAQKEKFAVILDIQLGNVEPVIAIKRALPYLKYPNVHLAVDPEFVVSNLKNTIPGKVVGHISAYQVNEIQEAMQKFMKENNINENKILIVHAFRKFMITSQKDLKTFDNIDLTINIDGFADPASKIGVFDNVIDENIQEKAFTGFKLFLNPRRDIPLMTPAQSLGLEPHNTKARYPRFDKYTQLKLTPNYINMQ